jgi:glyoxylase-like metal-dependent hydrolase (beta-lactamase superfamily II)
MPSDLHAPAGSGALQSIIPHLHATPTAPLPFLAGVVVRSFLLERPAGNIIVYNSPGIAAASAEILRLGRPERLLVNHWHEAMYGAPGLDVPICVHERDQGQTALPIAGTFTRREKLASDLEIIPTPGHTAGTTMFLWDTGGHHLLFPGDAIWVQHGEWRAVLLGESDRGAYIASLTELLGIEFDVLVPWGGEAGAPQAWPVTPAEARQHLQRIIDRLFAGRNS